ncbi:hypothetical protein QZH41_018085, partial [Actinostola sp. cb2023]
MADCPYSEDIVKNSQGTLGLVLQDAEETSEESDSEDEVLKKGQIVVCWYPSGHEETLLASKELIPGVHVSLGPWLGVVTESHPKLILRLKNGSRCCLEGEQTETLYDMSDQRDEESPFYSETFYPGQVVAGPSKVFKDAKWLSGVKPIIHSQTQMKGTVEEASILSCEVNWQVCGACGPDEENLMMLPPDATVTGDQLSRIKVINHYRHASIQMGDKAFYTVKQTDLKMAANCLGNNPSTLTPLPNCDDHAQNQTPTQGQHCLSPSSDGNTKTNLHDEPKHNDKKGAMQDDCGPTGTLSDSTDEDPDGGAHGAHRSKGSTTQGTKHDSSSGPSSARVPVKRRRKRAKRKRKATPHMQVNVGDRVCVEITSTCTTVNVIWQDRTRTTGVLSTHLTPVMHLDEHEFFPGDYVCDKRVSADSTTYGSVLTANCDARTCDIKWFTREGLELSIEHDVSVYDIAEHTDFVFNSGDVVVRMVPPDYCTSPMATAMPSTGIGQVITVDENGSVNIRWIDGTASYVIPQELYKVDTEDDDQSADANEHGSHGNSDDEWETASDESGDEASHDQDINIININGGENRNGGEENADNGESQGETFDNEGLDLNTINDMLSNRNPAFMMLGSSPLEHYFKLFPFLPHNLRKVMAAMQKELCLLHSSLPSGILLRCYEDRMDLYRVMITGPPGTPYEHGVFLFDIRLTPNYPNTPPQFHYLSMCSGRLNPNLYEDGKVCVSLLGTWSGKGSEVWTRKSSILQVLISIQGLILSSEPYYNEAGYEKQRGTQEGLDNSRLYNEMAILKLLQSMAKMISKPPLGFEKEIRLHFLEHVP